MRIFKGKISVIMPAYNEGYHIYNNLKETHATFKKAKCGFEIILVDDGSKDNTYEEALRAAQEIGNIIPVRLARNQGKGNALKEGFRHVNGNFVIFLDADLDLHPEQILFILKMMRDEQASVIIGSKHHPESRLQYPFMRKFFSRVYALMLKMLFGLPLKDTQTGLKIFRYEVLSKVFHNVMCNRYAFDVELLANAHHAGFKIAEAPVVIEYRREMNWGRIKFKDLYQMGMDTLAIYYRIRFRKTAERHYDESVAKEIPARELRK